MNREPVMGTVTSYRPAIDWVRIQAEYEVSAHSVRAIARIHEISHKAIQKRASRDGWTRDMGAQLQAKAEAKIAVATAAAETKEEMLEAGAELHKNIVLLHRTDLGRARMIVQDLFQQLEVATLAKEELAFLAKQPGESESCGGKQAQERTRALAALACLPARAATMLKLVRALARLIDKEREAYGIKASEPRPDHQY
jgi:hypothetical protein